MTPRRAVLWTMAVTLVMRVVIAATIGLGVDESYEVVMSRHPSPAYFEHPPLSFWLAGAAARLLGTEARLVVRLPFILLFAGTTWLLYRLTARLFDEWSGAWAALLLNLSLVFSISTGGWVLPDGPLMFCLVAAAWCMTKAILEDGTWTAWLGAGASAGLALLSKYHGIFALLGPFAFLVTSARHRRWLARPQPWIAAILAFAIFSPVLLWNARHGWISFVFQGGRGGAGGIHPGAVLRSLAGQVGYVLPWIWLPLVVALWRAIRGGPADDRRWFLACLATGPIVLFTLASLGGNPGLPHWEAPGYLLAFPLLGAAVAARMARGERGPARWLRASVAAFAVIVLAAGSQLALGWVSALVPSLHGRRDPGREMVDWRGLDAQLAAWGVAPGAGRFVGATDWIDAGTAGSALGPRAGVICFCDQPHHFPFVTAQDTLLGHDAVIVHSGAPVPVRALLAPYFRQVDSIGTVPVRRGRSVAVDLSVYVGRELVRPWPYPAYR